MRKNTFLNRFELFNFVNRFKKFLLMIFLKTHNMFLRSFFHKFSQMEKKYTFILFSLHLEKDKFFEFLNLLKNKKKISLFFSSFFLSLFKNSKSSSFNNFQRISSISYIRNFRKTIRKILSFNYPSNEKVSRSISASDIATSDAASGVDEKRRQDERCE